MNKKSILKHGKQLSILLCLMVFFLGMALSSYNQLILGHIPSDGKDLNLDQTFDPSTIYGWGTPY
ncbi:MAG: hypothetical protein KAH48_05705 [Chlorobi bacterium]|nr:hypothetical protein [Chlorobiota bacterium]